MTAARRGPLALGWLPPLVLGVVLGCGGPGPGTPSAAPTASTAAQRELRALEAEWEVGNAAERAALRRRLEEFLGRWDADPSAARARVLLGRLALGEGRGEEAARVVGPVLAGPPGRQRDEAQLVLAGVEVAARRYDAALARLEPLVGKLLTPEARAEQARLRVEAALGARRYRLAVEAMTALLVEAGRERARAEREVRLGLREVPAHTLLRLLSEWQAEPAPAGEQRRARDWLERVVVEQLSVEARSERDAELARDLLARAPTWLRASEAGDALALLAGRAPEQARLAGRTIGVVVGGADERARRRGVALAAGLLRGLAAAEAAGTPPVALLVEDEQGDLTAALGALAGRGASALVTGVDGPSAAVGERFAAARALPVLLATEPAAAATSSSFVFALGVSAERERAALLEGLTARGHRAIAVVGDDALPCPDRPARADSVVLPLEAWRARGVDAVAVLGDQHCATLVHAQLALGRRALALALGLEAATAPLSATAGRPALRLSSGHYPGTTPPPMTDRYVAEEGALTPTQPGWFQALGFDAALLLARAYAAVEPAETAEPEAVRAAHEGLRAALAAAAAELSTSDAPGFEGGRTLRRELRLEGPPPKGQSAPSGGARAAPAKSAP